MSFLHVAVVAIVQSISEVVPVGAEPHLELVPLLLPWPDRGAAMMLALELGILAAVAAYLMFDIAAMVAGLWRLLRGRRDPRARLFGQIVIGTVPLAAAVFLVRHYAGDSLLGLEILAWATIGFAVLLAIADGVGMTVRRIEHLQVSDAVVIGIAQAAAVIPGAGRAAITMAAARVLGFERRDAARFSLVLAIPVLLAACLASAFDLYRGNGTLMTMEAAAAAGLAFVAGLVAIAGMMAWLKKHSFTPFVLYRLVLGAGLLGFVYGWY